MTSQIRRMVYKDTSDEVVMAGVIVEIDDLRRGIERALGDTSRLRQNPESDEIAGWLTRCLKGWPQNTGGPPLSSASGRRYRTESRPGTCHRSVRRSSDALADTIL